MLTLYHLPISHYNEKVRWALDLKGVPHRRRALVPGIHRFVSRRHGGVGTTPLLVDDAAGKHLGDSTDILQYLESLHPEPRLYPDDPELRRRALEIEDALDRSAGRSVRSYAYCLILDVPGALTHRWQAGLSPLQRQAVRLLVPAIRPALRRAFRISPEQAPEHRRAVFAAADRLQGWLQESGDGYLVSGRFTVADLTAAALFGPAVGPEKSPWAPDTAGSATPAFVEFREQIRAHPAGRWVLDIWKNHRHTASREST